MNHGFAGEVYADMIPEGRRAIGTHSGTFHSDETLSVPMLRLLPEYRNHGMEIMIDFECSYCTDSQPRSPQPV